MSVQRLLLASVVVIMFCVGVDAQEGQRAQGDLTNVPGAPPDPRLKTRTLYQGNDSKPFTDKQRWIERAQYLREQVLMAAGLWPLPDKCELKPVIHGRIDRDGYTVEKVFFQSYPGFYVSGNLYRPKGKTGPFPAVLSPHGHWDNGRFYENSDKAVDQQIKGGWESDRSAAKYPLQARCANLAQLGCIVFHYDMVGYADSDPKRFAHRNTWRDLDSEMRLLSVFGLQTWDSIRALDFVLSLPDVDKSRIACTGASGGGTQTFILMSIEDRLKVAAPVCMISNGDHQGGCVCENAPLLRLFTDNVELAATFAPRPFVHPTATGDWTAHFMEDGLPEIQAIYGLFNATENIQAMRQKAEHNYNRTSREAVYNFFNTHLKLGQRTPIREQSFEPIPPKELSVFDELHPRPAEAVDPAALKKYLIDSAAAKLESLQPKDAASLDQFRQVLGTALRHMTATNLPEAKDTVVHRVDETSRNGFAIQKLLLSRKGSPEQIPAVLLVPANSNGSVTLVVTASGKAGLLRRNGQPRPIVAELLKKGQLVLGIDVFLTGQLAAANPTTNPSAEFYTGYNRTVLGNRVHDILTAVACMKGREGVRSVNLIGLGESGPWCLLARALAGDAVAKTVADSNQFDFTKVTTPDDENRLPGALKYGGIWPLAALAAPGQLFIYNTGLDDSPAWLVNAYSAAGAKNNLRVERRTNAAATVEWISQ